MLKKAMFVMAVLVVLLVGAGTAIYLGNAAPVVPRIAVEEAARGNKPYVIKLHAQWCAVCLVTKDVWSQIEETYATRVNLLVLDFTNDAKTRASRAEASRLGLGAFFDEYAGATGTILVLDGRTKRVQADISGSRDFSDYRAAIDAALDASRSR